MRSSIRCTKWRENARLMQDGAVGAQVEALLERHIATNQCPICYELMSGKQHQPTLLFPCGHTGAVKATPGDDDGARTASRLASFGIDDEPLGGETANTNNQLDRVLLTYLRHIEAAATTGVLQDAYRAFACDGLRLAVANLTGGPAADVDGGASDGEETRDGGGDAVDTVRDGCD